MAKGKYEYWLTDDGLLLLEAWARDGLTDEDLAKKIGISRSTLAEWKKKFSDISDALKKGKEIVDIEVENALLKRALGYSFTETTRERKLNPATGKYEMVITKEVVKDVQPEIAACFIWLKNRKPDVWRDKIDLDHGNGVAPIINITVSAATPADAESDYD